MKLEEYKPIEDLLLEYAAYLEKYKIEKDLENLEN